MIHEFSIVGTPLSRILRILADALETGYKHATVKSIRFDVNPKYFLHITVEGPYHPKDEPCKTCESLLAKSPEARVTG